MKTKTKKKNLIATVLLILLSATIVASAFSQVNAATMTGWKEPRAFLGLSRNPIGVGQTEILDVGIPDPIQTGSGWVGLSVAITKPDGTNTTINDITTDPAGSTGVVFVPDQVGNYTLQTHFPEQWSNYSTVGQILPQTPINILYKAADSPTVILTVQAAPVSDGYPYVPLPTEYWTRPINSQLFAWYSIGGNWLTPWSTNPNQNFLVDGNDQSPMSAHVLWTKPLSAGGLVGAPMNSSGYDVGEAYEYQFSGTIVMNGVLYYNLFPSTYASAQKILVAVDIRTGQELWRQSGVTVVRGQLFDFSTENQHGSFATIWATSGTTWLAYDAMTGDWLYNFTNVPSGTVMTGPSGEILILTVNLANGYMTLWNSSAVVGARGGAYGVPMAWNEWRPWGRNINATGPVPVSPETPTGYSGYSWNVTIPTGLPGSVVYAWPDDLVYGYWRGANVTNQVTIQTTPTDQFYAWAVSLKPQSRGTLLWNKTEALPAGNITITSARGPQDDQSRTFCVLLKETRQWMGFNLDTGNYLWTTAAQGFMDQYGQIGATWGNNGVIAYGHLYAIHYDGILYCYDITTGKTLWTYANADQYGTELRNTNFPSDIAMITNGMIVITPSEFNPLIPRPSGAYTVCLNATTGEVIWKLNFAAPGGGSKPVIGDNIIAGFNEYDNQIYSIGKGPSAVSVQAPSAAIALGNSLVISGTVKDISTGTTQSDIAPRFPNGVPAVSDDSMTEWMQYVYMQLPRPTNTTGVPVTLSVVDANGNYRQIGTVTSDSEGFYSLNWKPDITGPYTVIANFAGSNSYWPSSAEAAFAVDSGAPTASPYPVTVLPPTEMYIGAAAVAIIIAIAIVGVVMVLMLRKRP